VAVTGDHGVDLLLEPPRIVEHFSVAVELTGLVAPSARVCRNDHHIYSAFAQVGGEAVDDRNRIDESVSGDVFGHDRRVRLERHDSDDADHEGSATNDRCGLYPIDGASVRSSKVGADYRIVLLRHPHPQRVRTPIEIVIAHRGDVKLERIKKL